MTPSTHVFLEVLGRPHVDPKVVSVLDRLDLARQKIKLISTEDRVEITSPKEIVLTAGGSQIKINSKGDFVSTSAKFEAKAGQHCFEGGEKIIEEKI